MDCGRRKALVLYFIIANSILLIAMYNIGWGDSSTAVLVDQAQKTDKRLANEFSQTTDDLVNTKVASTNVSATQTVPIKSITIPKTSNKLWLNDKHFTGCQYSRCTFKSSEHLTDILSTDLIVLLFDSYLVPKLSSSLLERGKTVMVLGHEPQATRWSQEINYFNGSISHWRHSSIRLPYFTFTSLSSSHSLDIGGRNFAQGKTKGAFAYVSNCRSSNYNRLELMKTLSSYIDVDIYGGCTGQMPCSRQNFDCEARLHPKYRFFLAFENSLCEDYITEKFWKRLNSSAIFVPIAMGGLSLENYYRVAPADSFIHVYNFTSVRHLGEYLRHLMDDDAAYNRYHQWRSQYTVIESLHQGSCDMCEVAHNPQLLRKYERVKLADEFNQERNCRRFNNTAGGY